MARRAAAKGTRRPRKPLSQSSAAGGEDGAMEGARPDAAAKGSGGGFFCCYLLRSLCPRLKGRTYIGFTVNPRRRIRQHNGEISSGAWRTRRGRPWEMVLCIHGFPTNVAALQFEWAWQHPKESLAVREAAASFKSLSGVGNKVKLAYAMLNLPSWEKLNLTVNFFASTSTKFAASCPPLPSQMRTVVYPIEDLQYHAEAIREDKGPSSEENHINEDPQGHQGPDSLNSDEHSWKQASSDRVQTMEAQTRTAVYDVVDNYSSDDFAVTGQDGILDLTEPDGSRTSPQCSLSSNSDDGALSQEDNINEDPQAHQGPPDCPRRDGHSEHSWKQLSTDQVQRTDVQTRTAVFDVDDNYSSDGFVPMEWDGILDLTEPNGSTSHQCSLSSDGNSDGVVEDEVGHVCPVWKVFAGSADGCDVRVVDDELEQTSQVLKVCAGSDGRVFSDELGLAVSPMWKACAGSNGGAVDHELGQATPVLKVDTFSGCRDSGVTDNEFEQSSPVLMVNADSKEGEKDTVVDLVTPTPIGRLQRRAGVGSICHGIIDLTASPVVIEL